jgi:hypothetical protein
MICQYGVDDFWASSKFVCKWVIDVRVLVEDNAVWNLGLKLLGDTYTSGLLHGCPLRNGGKNRTNVTLIRVPFSLGRRTDNLST